MTVKLTENTILDISAVSLDRIRAFLKKNIEGFAPDAFCGEFRRWIASYDGKPLKEAIADYNRMIEPRSIEERLAEERFDIISEADKALILAFSKAIAELGYDYGGTIGSGFCWGRYMIIYSKVGVKSKQVAARFFIRDDHIVLRMFFNNIDKHRGYIENAPEHIKSVFTGSHGDCSCRPKKENCKTRKTYTIDGKPMEKCSGVVFEFHQPSMEKLPDYMGLLREFYAAKR